MLGIDVACRGLSKLLSLVVEALTFDKLTNLLVLLIVLLLLRLVQLLLELLRRLASLVLLEPWNLLRGRLCEEVVLAHDTLVELG